MSVSALVVGIDAYQSVPPLTGCVTDALEAVDWLLSTGVAAADIRLHLAATPAVQSHAGIDVKPADRASIWKSIKSLGSVEGERLFVFLSGHGYFLTDAGPIFLCEDWSPDDSDNNLAIEPFVAYFQGLNFASTFVVLDSCQSPDTASIYRSTIRPNGPSNLAVVANPNNGVLLCSAVSAGQYAPIIDGRGLLTRNLLTELKKAPNKLPEKAQDAYVYDWQTGEAGLDLLPLFKQAVAPAVRLVAGNNNQTPTAKLYGRFTSDLFAIVQTFPAPPLQTLTITASPPDGVYEITIGASPPRRNRQVTAADLQNGLSVAAPIGAEFKVICVTANGWVCAQPQQVNIGPVTQNGAVNFQLQPVPSAPAVDAFNLTVFGDNGEKLASLRDRLNFEVALPQRHRSMPSFNIGGGASAMTHGSPSEKSAFSPGQAAAADPTQPGELGVGLVVEWNDEGPDVVFEGASQDDGHEAVERLKDDIRSGWPGPGPSPQIFIAPPGESRDARSPNLRLIVPDNDPWPLVGHLSEEPLIHVTRIGSTPSSERGDAGLDQAGLSVREAINDPLLWRSPGTYRISLDTPWGSWSHVTDLDSTNIQRVSLDRPRGVSPLRNRSFARGTKPWIKIPKEPWIKIPGGKRSRIAVGPSSFSVGPPGLRLLVQGERTFVRIEPYADFAWTEWDHLIGAGRLDDIDVSLAFDRAASVEASIEKDVFLIALAYAALVQRSGDPLNILNGLSTACADAPDARLLKAAHTRTSLQDPVGLPFFRWGFDLLARWAPATSANASPQPASVWAVYDSVE